MLLVPSTLKAMCRPFSSQPTRRQLMQLLDDLAEGQGDDGQVVAPEPQHRDRRRGSPRWRRRRRPPPWRRPAAPGALGTAACRLMAAMMPEKAPTLMKPAWPRLSSPRDAHGQVQGHGHDTRRQQMGTSMAAPGNGSASPWAWQTDHHNKGQDHAQIGGEVHRGDGCSSFLNTFFIPPPHTFSRHILAQQAGRV